MVGPGTSCVLFPGARALPWVVLAIQLQLSSRPALVSMDIIFPSASCSQGCTALEPCSSPGKANNSQASTHGTLALGHSKHNPWASPSLLPSIPRGVAGLQVGV